MTDIEKLLEIMSQLRHPDKGCPWDVEQTFETIAPCTIEEAYEVADAIERGDMDDLKDELGDLLLQVVFHSQMAKEQNLFHFQDVVDQLSHKLVSRHPHVFDKESRQGAKKADDVLDIWEQQKQFEGKEKGKGLDSITKGLPALLRAQKIQKKAAKSGFEWRNIEDIIAKVEEELAELKHEIAENNKTRAEEEIGDLLFVLANLARSLHIDSEESLRKANDKFIRRYNGMVDDSQKEDKEFSQLKLEEMEKLWQAQKRKKA